MLLGLLQALVLLLQALVLLVQALVLLDGCKAHFKCGIHIYMATTLIAGSTTYVCAHDHGGPVADVWMA